MKRNARRPEPRRGQWGLLRAGAAVAGEAITRNPVAVGGTTAFLISLGFVSANALFYQPQMHPSAFVSTRGLVARHDPAPVALPEEHPLPSPPPARQQSRRIVPEDDAPPPAFEATGSVPDVRGSEKALDSAETVRAVQKVLADLSLYPGPVDGMTGPQTHAAIEKYRRIVGLEPGTQIDMMLLRQLGFENEEPAIPVEAANGSDDLMKPAGHGVQVASSGQGDSEIKRIQAGLKAFGNDGIEIDGVMGERTSEAIREFQSLFGLPVTGEPDKEFLAKMREIGLIQ